MNQMLTLARLTILFAATIYCADVHVRVIEAKTARPKPGVDVEVSVMARPGVPLDRPRSFRVQTDQTGTASFPVDPQTEPWLAILPQTGTCSPPFYEVSIVLLAGVVGKGQCWHTNAKLKDIRPSAGEIVVFSDKMSFWQALARPDLWP